MKKLFFRIYQGIMYVAAAFLKWREPVKLRGIDAMEQLAELLLTKGIDNVLVVTDKGLTALGLPNDMYAKLSSKGITYTVYDDTVPNPTIDNIEQARELYIRNNCKGIIAFGGGSSMDCAKGTAARIARPSKCIADMKGILKVGRTLPPLVAVPTTSGTGSETTLAAVITDSKTHHKYAINDPVLIPHYAVLDPMLTINLPKSITATTGMDALCHAVEAYIGRANTSATKRNAQAAVKLIFDNLYTAYCQPQNIAARENMQQASYLAGLAFTRAYVGYIHAIAHSLGGYYSVPHGLANAVIMPYVLRAFGSSVNKRLARLAEVSGVAEQGQSVQQKANAFIVAIEQLNAKMNIPTKIPQIKEQDIEQMARFAYAEGNPQYPVPKIFDKAQLESIYKQLMP